jgi:hypothetical protein
MGGRKRSRRGGIGRTRQGRRDLPTGAVWLGMTAGLAALLQFKRPGAPDYPGLLAPAVPLPAGFDQGPFGGPGSPPCLLTTTAQDLWSVPFTWDQAEIEFARDRYLAATAVGNYVIALWYANEAKLVDRAKEIDTEPADRALAQALYTRYLGQAKLALTTLEAGGGPPLNEQHYTDAQAAMLTAKKYLSKSEVKVMEKVFDLLREKAPAGTSPREFLAVLDDKALLAEVKQLATSVGYLKTDVDRWVKEETR